MSEVSKPHSALDMARGYAVPDSPSHINVLACEVVRLYEQLEAAQRRIEELERRNRYLESTALYASSPAKERP